MRFIFNPDAEEFIPKAEEEHRHSGERYGYSVERGEAGHSVGKQTLRHRGRECRVSSTIAIPINTFRFKLLDVNYYPIPGM